MMYFILFFILRNQRLSSDVLNLDFSQNTEVFQRLFLFASTTVKKPGIVYSRLMQKPKTILQLWNGWQQYTYIPSLTTIEIKNEHFSQFPAIFYTSFISSFIEIRLSNFLLARTKKKSNNLFFSFSYCSHNILPCKTHMSTCQITFTGTRTTL